MDDLGKKIKEISDSINSETLEYASDEELLEYLFLIEKLKLKIEKLVEIEGKAE